MGDFERFGRPGRSGDARSPGERRGGTAGASGRTDEIRVAIGPLNGSFVLSARLSRDDARGLAEAVLAEAGPHVRVALG